jgi:hypothetical protein
MRSMSSNSSFDRFLPRLRGPVDGFPSIAGPIVAQYRDLLSGCTFVVARPCEQPQLWLAYLDGAVRSYRKHDVEAALEYAAVVDGASTALFFVALDPNNQVVGGMRAQGPYLRTIQAHALAEWDGREGTVALQEEITARLADGVIEMKTGWVDETFVNRRKLTAALARIPLHSIRLMGVRWAMCTVGQHAVVRWQTTGGIVSEGVCSVGYPDHRYRTVLVWWDQQTFAQLTAPEQLPHVIRESAQCRNGAQREGPPVTNSLFASKIQSVGQ